MTGATNQDRAYVIPVCQPSPFPDASPTPPIAAMKAKGTAGYRLNLPTITEAATVAIPMGRMSSDAGKLLPTGH